MVGLDAWLKDPSGFLDNNDGLSPSYLQQDMQLQLNEDASSMDLLNSQGEQS